MLSLYPINAIPSCFVNETGLPIIMFVVLRIKLRLCLCRVQVLSWRNCDDADSNLPLSVDGPDRPFSASSMASVRSTRTPGTGKRWGEGGTSAFRIFGRCAALFRDLILYFCSYIRFKDFDRSVSTIQRLDGHTSLSNLPLHCERPCHPNSCLPLFSRRFSRDFAVTGSSNRGVCGLSFCFP